MKKSATMGVLGQETECKHRLEMNGNVFQRPTRPLLVFSRHFLQLWVRPKQIY